MCVGVVGLGEGLGTVVFAHPSKAGATVGSVGPVVSVSLSRLSPEDFFTVLVSSGSGTSGCSRLAIRRFQAS